MMRHCVTSVGGYCDWRVQIGPLRMVFLVGLAWVTTVSVTPVWAQKEVGTGPPKQQTQLENEAAEQATKQASKDATVVQALKRIKNFDLNNSPPTKAAVVRHLRANPSSPEFLQLTKRFRLTDMSDLLAIEAANHCEETRGVDAARLLLDFKSPDEIQSLLSAPKTADSPFDPVALFAAMGRTEEIAFQIMALQYAVSNKRSPELRRAAITAAGRSKAGRAGLLEALQAGDFGEDLHMALANVLLGAKAEDVHATAKTLLKLPQSASREPLPPLAELVGMKGDKQRGAAVFRKEGTCIKCHRVGDEGKLVGPNLDEIGSKLAKEAMYVSILDPSAAISFNYETYNVLLEDGREVTGILTSETDDAVTIKSSDAIEQTIERMEIDEIVPIKLSLMPSGLVQNMTTQQFVDLVEYLLSLKKKES